MNARTNLSALLSVVAVAVLSTSAVAAEPVKVIDRDPVVAIEPDVQPITPFNPDYNMDGSVDMRDIFDFFSGWFGGKPNTDVDGDGQLSGLDVLEYLNVWFGYTPAPTQGKK